MVNDILPKNKVSAAKLTDNTAPQMTSEPEPQLHHELLFKKKRLIIALLAVIAFFVVAAVSLLGWFYILLQPPFESGVQKRVTIEQGQSLSAVAEQLKQQGLIKNPIAFQLYTRLRGVQGNLQAGTYALSPTSSVQEIVTSLVEGRVKTFTITIYPGNTLAELSTTLVKEYGFDKQAVEVAFNKKYDHPLLIDKPESSTLEGYIFPDTYEIQSNGSVEELLEKSFTRFNDLLTSEKMTPALKAQNLSLHQAIILSSIVQKEVSNASDQKQVAQVFLKRLSIGMELGSDVTFIYAAEQLGVEPRVNLDSPYNTRIQKGLPPGPIANFNLTALQAVANPAPGDFLYFVAGDGEYSDQTYFSRTLQEHEDNVQKYCRQLCQ